MKTHLLFKIVFVFLMMAPQSANLVADDKLTTRDVQMLLSSGVSPDEIVAQIKQKGFADHPTEEQMQTLRQQGVTAEVLLAIGHASAPASPSAYLFSIVVGGTIRKQEDGHFIVSGGKFGFINSIGQVIINPKFDNVDIFKEGFCAFKANDKWGYMDSNGRTVIAPIYDDAYAFSDGFARVKEGDKWHYIDHRGGQTFNGVFESCSDFDNGLAPVLQDGQSGYVTKEGKFLLTDERGKSIPSDSPAQGFIRFKEYGSDGKARYGYMDPTGKKLTSAIFVNAAPFNEGVAIVIQAKIQPIQESDLSADEKTQMQKCFLEHDMHNIKLIDRHTDYWSALSADGTLRPLTQKSLIHFIADNEANDQDGNVFIVKNNDQVSDIENNEPHFYCQKVLDDDYTDSIIAESHNDAGRFQNIVSEGLLAYWYGFVDPNGKIVFTTKLTPQGVFQGGLCLVSTSPTEPIFGFIGKDGTVVGACNYDYANGFTEGRAVVKKNDLYGFIDPNGKEVIPLVYKRAFPFSNGLAEVITDDSMCYINPDGVTVWSSHETIGSP